MTVIYVNWNEAEWSLPVFRTTGRVSGANVIVVSDGETGMPGIERMKINAFLRANHIREQLIKLGVTEFESSCIARWFVIGLLVTQDGVLPAFCADRDEFILCPEEIPDCDVGCTFDRGIPRAPIYIANPTPVKAFCDQIEFAIEHKAPSVLKENDMTLWRASCNFFGWKVADLSRITAGAVYDHGLGQGDQTFEFDDGKRIEWKDGKPYFVALDGSPRVLARSIHCWGPFKKYITAIESKLL